MKVLYINAGLEEGGAKTHMLSLLSQFPADEIELLVLEEGTVSKEARLIGIKVHVINQRSRYDLTILKKIIVFINENQFDVIHSHGARANFLIAIIKKKIHSNFIVTVHSDPDLDFMDRGLKGRVFSYLNVWSLSKADKLILVTDSLKSHLVKKDILEEKMFVVYNGINFDGGLSVKRPHKRFTITCVARLHPVKAHALLFESLKLSSLTNFHLNIIGDGELREILEKKVLALNFKNQIQFHGTLEKNEIERILEQTDLTVLTSISEGFPLVLLESANQKIPFISTDVGDIGRLLPDSSFGWLIPKQDKLALSLALNEAYQLWQSGELSKKGNNLFQLASKEYSLENMYSETLAVYETEISGK